MLKKIWFIGIICLCLALSIGILNSKAISKRTKTKIESWYKFVEKFGEYQPEFSWKIIYEYDSEGNEVKEANYGSEIGLLWTKTFEYDEKGDKVSKEQEYSYKPELDKETYEHRYDEKGNKIEVSAYNADGELNTREVYKYDEDGNKIEEIYESPSYLGIGYFSREVYKYDETGNRIGISEYSLDGELVGESTFEFDEKGREIKEAKYDEKGELEGKWTYKYNKKVWTTNY